MKASVIIPAYNAETTIGPLLDSLANQTYPRDNYQVIVVDNGSTDSTRSIVRKYTSVTLLECTGVQSSYAARNMGIKTAKGNILLFTDADCTAQSDWIEQMAIGFETTNASVLAGNVQFTFSNACTAAEQWDSLTHMHNASCVKKGHAKTANIAVRRDVFDRVGFFPEVTSGGDVSWTSLAVQSGEVLLYVDSAIVFHPARMYRELMQKYIRVSGGSIQAWRDMKRSYLWIVLAIFSLPLPLVYRDVIRYIKERGREDIIYTPFWIMVVAYIGRLYAFWGIVRSIITRS